MMTTTTWRTVVREPLDLALAQPHQVLLSSGSVAIMAQFAAHGGIVHPLIGYLIAIGVEWAYLRGLAYNERVSSRWGVALIWVAFAIMIIWGVLWAAYIYGAYTLQPTGAAAWLLAAAHIVPIGAMALCAAMAHQAAANADKVQQVEAEQWQQQLARRQAEERAALAIERERQQIEAENEYRRMKIAEEQKALQSDRRRSAKVSAKNTKTRDASLVAKTASNASNAGASNAGASDPLACPHCQTILPNYGAKGRAVRYGYCSSCKPTKETRS